MNLKAKAKSKFPIRRRAPGATTSAISPPRMSEADMATVSISDCLSMLPSFDKKTEELNAGEGVVGANDNNEERSDEDVERERWDIKNILN